MFWQKKPPKNSVTLNLEGMHCASCAMLIDNELEDLPGVRSSKTSYATCSCQLEIDQTCFKPDEAIKAIENLGYTVKKS